LPQYYDNKGKKKRWQAADSVICDYMGIRVRHSKALSQSYKSPYVCELEPGWDIDAQD